MKYPQLVSTRAVNAISDWLVSRLEQLGVEAPLIYSRLLLSLLQSSVQINDPIEFNNLEKFLANRKGKRYPSCDTNTLKKLAAIQCLMDTVSSEQEISSIETLIDELFDKLNDIENRIEQEDNDFIEDPIATSLEAGCNHNQDDPRKRYYNAFPALCKEMEDSVKHLKSKAKDLTWPTNRNSSTGATTSLSSALANTQANSTLPKTAGVKRKTKRRRNQVLSKSAANIRKSSTGSSCSPTWDTDFEGSWEMGRDLIKEFIVKQNSRNRSTSESAAYNKSSEHTESKINANASGTQHNRNKSHLEMPASKVIIEDTSINSDAKMTDSINSTSITIDEGYSTHENFTSLSEITEGLSMVQRRLYDRDVVNDSLNSDTLTSAEQRDFDQFKAKFNSSVEALWKNEALGNENSKSLDYFGQNFILQDLRMINAAAATIKTAIESDHDYYSMPNYNPTKFMGLPKPEKLTPICMFLQDSIWSENSSKSYSDSDDSFYSKVLISSYNKQDSKIAYHVNNISKWSEGINGGASSCENSFVNSSSNTSIDSCVSSECFNRDATVHISKNVQYLSEGNGNYIQSPLKKVSLSNHSEASNFIEYTRTKPAMEQKPKVEKPIAPTLIVNPIEEEENLLTSERTHFHPIKQSYSDGHTFDISSVLDEIDYERSPSGGYYLEADKYLEYQPDGYITDDDVSLFSSYSSSSHSGIHFSHNNQTPKQNCDFVIKFRVKKVDTSCQTERASPTNIQKGIDNYMQCDEDVKSSCEQNMAQWSMAEICKNCVHNTAHTLWGVCTTCNNATQSQPANSKLKDELKIEADEIMSDLRYMQDLYIGSDWEDDENDDDTDLDAETIRDCDIYQAVSKTSSFGSTSNDLEECCAEGDLSNSNVTKLIADLLKPENAKTLACALGNGNGPRVRLSKGKEDNNNCDDNYIGGLWNDENRIWQNEFKPIEILSKLNTSNINESFSENLNWEHSNLANIWNTNSSPLMRKQECENPAEGAVNQQNEVKTSVECHDLSIESEEEEMVLKVKQELGDEDIVDNSNKYMPSPQKEKHPKERLDGELLASFLEQARNICNISSRIDRKRRHSSSHDFDDLYMITNNNNTFFNKNPREVRRAVIAASKCCGNVQIGARTGPGNRHTLYNTIALQMDITNEKQDVEIAAATATSATKTIITCNWTAMDTAPTYPFIPNNTVNITVDALKATSAVVMCVNPVEGVVEAHRELVVSSRPFTR